MGFLSMALKIILCIIAFLILFFVAIMIIDCHRFVVRNYEIPTDKDINSFRIVMLSDLHSSTFGKNNSRLSKAVIDQNPDAVIIAGDMYTAVKNENIDCAAALLEAFEGKFPVYYSNGNHELKAREREDEFGTLYEDFKRKITCGNDVRNAPENNVYYLENERVTDKSGSVIYGLDLPFEYYKKFMNISPGKDGVNNLLGTCDLSNFNILIAHNPEYFSDYSEWGADLVLSGHYHGGLMRLPFLKGVISPRYKLFPHYSYGTYIFNKSTMILSCGLGTHTLPIRIFNPGEVSVIDIKRN